MRQLTLLFALLLAVIGMFGGWTAPATASSLGAETRLTAADPTEGAQFGAAVALSGTLLVVGAPGASAAYVFTHDGTGWRQVARLTPSDASARRFGAAVATDGTTIVAGAPGQGNGAAYVFTNSGTGWRETAILTAGDPLNLFFGFSVAVSGAQIAVGAPYSSSPSAPNIGAAYTFTNNGSGWTRVSRLTTGRTGGAARSDNFGWSVALSNTTLAIGAPTAGAAFVYRSTGTEWVREATLGDGSAGSRFGFAASAGNQAVVIGAPQDGASGVSAGAATLFGASGANWTEQARLVPTAPANGFRFGAAVALSGDRIVVGAPESKGRQDIEASGAAYVYARSGARWELVSELNASDAAPNDTFGTSVAASATAVAVGAPGDDHRATNSGSVYVYGLNGQTPDPAPEADCLDMRAEGRGVNEVLPGVQLAWHSVFRCTDAPREGTYSFDVTVSRTGGTGALLIERMDLTHTTPRPLGRGPEATFETVGLPFTLSSGESKTFSVRGTYALVSTGAGAQANLHFCTAGSGDGVPFSFGLNALLRASGTDEDEGDITPPTISQLQVRPTAEGTVVTWRTDEPATSSVTYWSVTSADEPQEVSHGCRVATDHRVTLGNLIAGVSYIIQVEARDADGNSARSAPITFGPLQSQVALNTYVPFVVGLRDASVRSATLNEQND
jgi:hypothetical protein